VLQDLLAQVEQLLDEVLILLLLPPIPKVEKSF
jgi:hypothetical protein